MPSDVVQSYLQYSGFSVPVLTEPGLDGQRQAQGVLPSLPNRVG
jgi:hypothetical protein